MISVVLNMKMPIGDAYEYVAAKLLVLAMEEEYGLTTCIPRPEAIREAVDARKVGDDERGLLADTPGHTVPQ